MQHEIGAILKRLRWLKELISHIKSKRHTLLLYTFLVVLIIGSFNNNEEELHQRRNGPIEIYFNSPSKYTQPSRRTTSDIGLALIDTIDRSKESIDFAIYGMRNQLEVYQALLRAKQRGVKIRAIVDMNVDGKSAFKDTNKLFGLIDNIKTDYTWELVAAIKENRPVDKTTFWEVPEGFEGQPQMVGYSFGDNQAIIAVQASIEPYVYKGSIMHDKFFIIDHQIVWTGSANVTDTDTGGYNANIACVINNKQVALAYTQEFEQMYIQDKYHQEKDILSQDAVDIKVDDDTYVTVLFSPQQTPITSTFIPLIRGAKTSIKIPMFYLTHKKLAGELIKAKERGVDIKIILDAMGATSGYTKHQILREAGIQVKVENFGGMMHMKTMVIDDEYAIIGSVNFTKSGDVRSDENTLVIHSPYYAKEVSTIFDNLWDSIPDKYLTVDPPAESKYSINSMTDGLDNDYDNLIDKRDDPTPTNKQLPPYKIVQREPGNNLIKGLEIKEGVKVYFLPNDQYYDYYKEAFLHEEYFPSVEEAKEAGYLPFNYNKYILD